MTASFLPRMYRIRQDAEVPVIDHIPSAVRGAIDGPGLASAVRSGDSVAVTAGSRNIAGIATVMQSVIASLRGMGAHPFIVPAMGSHGGGTAEGQAGLLARYGMTEEALGCPVCSSMDVVNLGTTAAGFPVLVDRTAHEADHIVVVNRIKPHTRFTAPVESGLVKMSLVGLGKAEGARIYHRAIDRLGWPEVYTQSFPILSSKARLLFGLAVMENARRGIGAVAALRPEEFLAGEPLLLGQARAMMPGIPLADLDLLIVDEMGKDISGTGMDTNVTGRKEGHASIARRIFVRDLSAGAGGNALGIGMADFTTRRLVDKIDHHTMYLNARTAYRTDACKIPMTFESDIEAIEAAAFMSGMDDPARFRIAWIKNTMDLETFLVSEACLQDIRKNRSMILDAGPGDSAVDPDGNLVPPPL